MLSLRTRLFIIISIAVLFVLGVSIFLVIRSKTLPTNNSTSTTTSGDNTVESSNFNYSPTIETAAPGGVVPQGTTIKPETSLEIEQNFVKQLAKIFVERYNSYSTDGNFQNIVEVKDLVTPDLWQMISGKIIKTSSSGSFVGVTTKVITTELKNWDNSSAVVYLVTNIKEEKNGEITGRQQAVTIELVKSGDNWLVNKFQWEK